MKILLVEDDKQIAEFLEMSLAAEYFSVDVAHDGQKGLSMALENSYDLFILDNMLPKKTGLEICKQIRNAKITTPILILSVLSDTSDKIKLLDAGADDYLIKPFSLQELIARTRALLRRPKKTVTPILSIDDVVLDTKLHAVKRGKKDIRLTRKEFALLEYMMKNQDTVLTRGMLMENIWSTTMDPFSNTIEAHMLSLRKKLDVGSKQKIIHTVPGVGYKMARNY